MRNSLSRSLARGAAFAMTFGAATQVSANPTAGVDVALFRASYDTGGIFSLEGARLMPKRDISWKMLLSYAKSPVDVAVPGIGGADDTADAKIRALREAGVVVAMSPADMGKAMAQAMGIG